MTLGPLFMFEKVKGTKLCQPRILQVATYIPIIVIETLDPYTYTRQFRLVSFRCYRSVYNLYNCISSKLLLVVYLFCLFIYSFVRSNSNWNEFGEKNPLFPLIDRYTFRLAPASTNRIEYDRREAPRGALRRVMTAFRVPRRSFAIKHRATAANLRYSIDKIVRRYRDSWRALGIETIKHIVATSKNVVATRSDRFIHILSSLFINVGNGYKNSKRQVF